MGYFALPNDDTAEEYIKTAIANLELLLKSSNKKDYAYLLGFAEVDIERARKALKNNPRKQR